MFCDDSEPIAVVDVLSIGAGRVGSVSIYLMRFGLIETLSPLENIRVPVNSDLQFLYQKEWDIIKESILTLGS